MTTNTNATARANHIANRLPGPVDHYVDPAKLDRARATGNLLAIMRLRPVCGARARTVGQLFLTGDTARVTCARCAAYLDARGR
ncbi:MAG: hypothetical protein Q4F65_13845 [Propionibacteriaceae bacterium]|nr:hypothetical protein [Propionibacteriaceae bacterium]